MLSYGHHWKLLHNLHHPYGMLETTGRPIMDYGTLVMTYWALSGVTGLIFGLLAGRLIWGPKIAG